MLIPRKTGCFFGDPGGTYPQKHTLYPPPPPNHVFYGHETNQMEQWGHTG